ncbi:MAG: 23S rRNA pseudouridine2605 synthase [Saprospiraceae bacterium]|jgi:23S rRNA pseudouridine2605 synthase
MSKDKNPPDQKASEEGMRLNKYVAHCGICSRRKAAEYVMQGHINVNDQLIKEPGHRVLEGDKVYFKGELIEPEVKVVYLLMNKPKNTITTASDEKGRRTVFDLIGDAVDVRIFPVGRLDRETTGLLLLTNDGDLTKKLSHPSHKVEKFYHIVLDRPVAPEHIQQIREGITLEDGFVPVDSVDYITNAGKEEVGIEIHIGRNRIVRRIFEHFGYVVQKLERTYYAGLTKKNLARGRFRHLTEKEVLMLKHFT